MKNFIYTAYLVASISFTTGFSINNSFLEETQEIQITESGCHVIDLRDLTDNGLEDFFSGALPQTAIEIPEGAGLPLNLSLTGDFLTLESNNSEIYTFKVIKTCFLRCVKGTFLFSTDLQNWAEFDEFFSGSVNVSLDTSEGAPKVGISIELKQK
jgi:hypothetical protein